MIERSAPHYTFLEFEIFAGQSSLVHAVFTRLKGHSRPPFAGLNASFVTGDDPAAVSQNKAEVVSALGMPLIGARPTHAAQVVAIEDHLPPDFVAERDATALQQRIRAVAADAMLTTTRGLALCWAFGDCAPILLFDPAHEAIALVHAGWRGTAQAVAARAIEAMERRYDTRRGELLCGIGPSIGACCYAVGENVRDAFAREPLALETACFEERMESETGGRQLYLDVGQSNYTQLIAAGIPAHHIEYSGYCTGCRTDLFFSHRKEPWPSGRFAVAIGLSQSE